MVARPLGRAPLCLLLRNGNLSTATGLQLPVNLSVLTTGLSRKVIVAFPESLPQSDRGCSRKVIVDKSAYPKALPTVARLPHPAGCWPATK